VLVRAPEACRKIFLLRAIVKKERGSPPVF
jgi:hypothetical protein